MGYMAKSRIKHGNRVYVYERENYRDENGHAFCLHGLNAVFLPKTGWYRIDSRGNREDINAQFDLPFEHLAYTVKFKGEANLPEIWPEPLQLIVRTLSEYHKYNDVLNNLPYIRLIL